MQNQNYPSEWQKGIPRGSVKEVKGGIMLTISPPGEKQISKFFSYSSHGKNAQQNAIVHQYKVSAEMGLTRNQLRYIDENTIEVQLTNDKVAKFDAADIDKVNLFPLQAKAKKTPKGTTYYAYYQDKKKAEHITKLLTDYKITEFINSDTLDLRRSNMKEFGSVKIADKAKEKSDVTDDTVSNQFDYFNMKIDNLPKDIWLLGKPAGTRFKRKDEDIITVRVTDDDKKQHAKTFNIGNYESEELADLEARKWQIETSYKLGLTKNLIRIINETTIEVQLTKDKIMKTDKVFIPMIQSIPLFIATSGNGIDYVATTLNDRNKNYHNLITNFEIVDHIDGNGLNNCLKNLRASDTSLNNSNRHNSYLNLKVKSNLLGDAYRARIKIDGKSFEFYFFLKDYTEDAAKEMASRYKHILTKCDHVDEKVALINNDKLIKTIESKINKVRKLIMKSTCYDIDNYITNYDDIKEKKKMHYYYLENQAKYYQELSDKLNKIASFKKNKNNKKKTIEI